jgi:predicted  nucleic acid-binding Zn-ribbon protein
VPGLSFEVNQTVYDNEIDSAMDVLWLTDSLQQNINSKQARKTYAQQMVTTLNDEVEDFTDQYQQANDTITNLRPRIDQLNTNTENLKVQQDVQVEGSEHEDAISQ